MLDTLDGIPVYDNTITRNLMYFIRVYPAGAIDATPEYIIEVLTPYRDGPVFQRRDLQRVPADWDGAPSVWTGPCDGVFLSTRMRCRYFF